MFSIAQLLDSSKANARIESDYRLAKVLRINPSAISNYRTGVSLPNVEIIEALCALSGDDAGLIVAHVEAARAKPWPVRAMWAMRRCCIGAWLGRLRICVIRKPYSSRDLLRSVTRVPPMTRLSRVRVALAASRRALLTLTKLAVCLARRGPLRVLSFFRRLVLFGHDFPLGWWM